MVTMYIFEGLPYTSCQQSTFPSQLQLKRPSLRGRDHLAMLQLSLADICYKIYIYQIIYSTYVSSIFPSTVVPFSAKSMRYRFHLRLHNVVYIRRSSGRCHIARPLSFEQLLYHDQAVPPFVIWMRIIIVIIIIDHLDQHNLVRFPNPLASGGDNFQVRWEPCPASSS